MKKRIIIVVCVVALLLAGVGGSVYAATHTPVKGSKLIGLAHLGTITDVTGNCNAKFYFNNPDCTNKITISKVCIIKGNGSVVYEGSYIQYDPSTNKRTKVTTVMNPHNVWVIPLANYMYKGSDTVTRATSWLSEKAALDQPVSSYTVEIAYTLAKSTACPLTGWWQQSHPGCAVSDGHMINMTQS